jgi:hypothetical protein
MSVPRARSRDTSSTNRDAQSALHSQSASFGWIGLRLAFGLLIIRIHQAKSSLTRARFVQRLVKLQLLHEREGFSIDQRDAKEPDFGRREMRVHLML